MTTPQHAGFSAEERIARAISALNDYANMAEGEGANCEAAEAFECVCQLEEVQRHLASLPALHAEVERLRGENEKLRAYAECAQCWREYTHDAHEDKSDWSKTLRNHGWNPSENGPVEFIDSLRTAALTPTATGGTK